METGISSSVSSLNTDLRSSASDVSGLGGEDQNMTANVARLLAQTRAEQIDLSKIPAQWLGDPAVALKAQAKSIAYETKFGFYSAFASKMTKTVDTLLKSS